MEPTLNRQDAFKAAAAELDATFLPGKKSSADEVHLEHGSWRIILDTYVESDGTSAVTYTRARALYVAKERFTLRIARKNVLTKIAAKLGFPGLLIGDRELERKYKITTSSEPHTRSLLTDRAMRELILIQPSLRLEIRRQAWSKRRKTGEGVREVRVRTTGVITEPDRLAHYMRLVASTLDQLVRIGVAYEDPVEEGRQYELRRRGPARTYVRSDRADPHATGASGR